MTSRDKSLAKLMTGSEARKSASATAKPATDRQLVNSSEEAERNGKYCWKESNRWNKLPSPPVPSTQKLVECHLLCQVTPVKSLENESEQEKSMTNTHVEYKPSIYHLRQMNKKPDELCLTSLSR